MTEMTFTPADLEQFARRGVAAEEAARQIEYLKTPPPAIVLHRPCTIGDGIARIEPHDHGPYVDRGDAIALSGRVMKFVPASGAATRMFKDLIAALDDPRRPSDSPAARELFENLDTFAFGEEVRRRTRIDNGPSSEAEERLVLRTILEEMGYVRMPKGLIPFHRGERPRTAFEEHLLEGARYARANEGTVRMHFTVAPEARDDFEKLVAELAPGIERRRRGCSLDVTFSEQHPSTDTLAVDEKGEPFRRSDGSLLFRPGGHGSLLHNLERTAGDIVSIKNIDNILPDEMSAEVVRWKRMLIGFLAHIQQEVFAFLAACSDDSTPEEVLDRAIAFAAFRFSRKPHSRLDSRESKREFVIDALDRPLRVCGVVKNEGEPGGAPFWVEQPDGTRSVQIVESSQVDMGNPEQVKIFKSSTHFNPVDIVCGLRSWKGESFDLDRFVDHGAVFMSNKSYDGRELRALERPGLWNGAMAHWNTICVEVPGSTFAPVKTVFDLLRPQHQFQPTTVEAAPDTVVEGHVLVVDDQAMNQRILEKILTDGGFEVSVAGEGERALHIARGGDIDLVLLDIVLPGLDGYEIITRLRQETETRDIPVIFISSLDEVADKVKGLELGAADYVTKPFNRHEVLARVRAQLRIRHLTRSLSRANAQLREKQDVITADLRAAADIQKALLPQWRMQSGTLDSASVFQPSMHIGGDIFNIVPLHDGRVAAYIADVSGHGVASALLTVSLTQRLSAPAGLLDGAAGTLSPAAVLRQLEAEYPFERFNKYFSLVLALIEPESGRITYSSAGHPPPFIAGADGGVKWLRCGGPIIGMGFAPEFDEEVLTLERGDRMVLYTDGVTEDESSTGEPFGEEALAAMFSRYRDEALEDSCERVLDHLAERRGDAPPSDDIAILAFQRSKG